MLDMMRRYLGIGVAWVGATILSVAIASTAVAGIRDRVVETPVAIGAPTTTTSPATDTTTSTSEATTTTSTTTTTEAPQTTTTEVASGSTTSTTDAPVASTTTTTTTTTTTAAPSLDYKTYSMVGGTVTLAVGDGQVSVASVVANPGFHAEVEKNGPNEVQVEFEGNEHKSELTAQFEGGELKVRTSEEGEDDDGDHDGDD